MPSEINQGYEFYGSQYARFGTAVAAEIRREVYGVDIGQQGWRSMDEQRQIIEVLQKYSCKDVLDVACGSGGPSLAIAQQTGCKLTGVDLEQNAVTATLGFAMLLYFRQGLSKEALAIERYVKAMHEER